MTIKFHVFLLLFLITATSFFFFFFLHNEIVFEVSDCSREREDVRD